MFLREVEYLPQQHTAGDQDLKPGLFAFHVQATLHFLPCVTDITCPVSWENMGF